MYSNCNDLHSVYVFVKMMMMMMMMMMTMMIIIEWLLMLRSKAYTV